MLNLRKYFLRPCRLILACALGTSVVLQSVAYGIRPVILTDRGRKPRTPVVERDYSSGDVEKTLLDMALIDCVHIRLEYDIPSVRRPAWVQNKKFPRICDVPNKCSDLEAAKKVFRETDRLVTCVPDSLRSRGIGFNIVKKGATGGFRGLISFICAPPEAPGTRARLFVKRWLYSDLSDSEESREEISMCVGLALANMIQVLRRNGCSFDIVMDYDFEPDQVVKELIVAQRWLDERRNCEWEINEFGDPIQIELNPVDDDMVSVSCTSIGKVSELVKSEKFSRDSVDPLIFRGKNIARAFRFSLVA